MRRILPAALAALLGVLPLAAHADSLEQTFALDGEQTRAVRYERSTLGSLVIEPDGRVSDVDLDLPAREREVYQRLLGRWQLDPIERDGVVVRAKAHFHIDLYAEKVPDQPRHMRFGVENVTFIDPPGAGAPERRRSDLRPPRYPMAMAQEQTGARVMLLLKLDGDGRVTDAAARDVELFAHRLSSTRVAGSKAERFVSRSIEAARGWVIGDARAVAAGSVLVPVNFMPPGTGPDTWQPVFAVRASQLPWMQAIESGAIALTASGQSGAEAFRLRSSLDDTAVN